MTTKSDNQFVLSKTINCEDLIHVLVQYPEELKQNKQDEYKPNFIKKPITCFVSNKEIIQQKENVGKITNEKIDCIYYITPNPKKIGGEDYLQTTLMESHEDQTIRNLGLKLSMLIFRQLGLSKTPVYLYLIADVKNNIQWEGDILQILTAFKSNVKI
ncbi:hypothetical protein QEN19_001521 [Hanseniaspora menglaensis]